MSDPLATTSCQKAVALARRLGLRRFWRKPPLPGNLQARDAGPEAIARDVDYGFESGKLHLYRLKLLGVAPKDASILEVGPGIAFGGMAYLAAFGARVAVADRWLAPWQDDYHARYYDALAQRIETEGAGGDARPIRALAASGSYEGGSITLIHEPAEDLRSVPDGAFEVVFSNAVLEHVANPSAAIAELHRVTKDGGYGVHQVDFRDHRDFDRPLEHLLLAEKSFSRLTKGMHHEYGSQLRQADYAAIFEEGGFSIVDYQNNDRATDEYLDDLTARLMKQNLHAFSREQLGDLGGLFFVRRACAE